MQNMRLQHVRRTKQNEEHSKNHQYMLSASDPTGQVEGTGFTEGLIAVVPKFVNPTNIIHHACSKKTLSLHRSSPRAGGLQEDRKARQLPINACIRTYHNVLRLRGLALIYPHLDGERPTRDGDGGTVVEVLREQVGLPRDTKRKGSGIRRGRKIAVTIAERVVGL